MNAYIPSEIVVWSLCMGVIIPVLIVAYGVLDCSILAGGVTNQPGLKRVAKTGSGNYVIQYQATEKAEWVDIPYFFRTEKKAFKVFRQAGVLEVAAGKRKVEEEARAVVAASRTVVPVPSES